MDDDRLTDAEEIIRELLECCELNLDEIEPATQEIIDKAQEFLIGTHNGRRREAVRQIL